jgi:hypothetical protein
MHYPKLLISIPFTPATGQRILAQHGATPNKWQAILKLRARILPHVCHRLDVSSVHFNFCAEDEIDALQNAGFLHRKGVQYHFTNVRKGQVEINAFEKALQESGDKTGNVSMVLTGENSEKYLDFDDYLNEFKSKKRIKMRREQTVVRNESGLRIEVM